MAGMTPASFWIGSSMIATVRASTAACRAARSLNGTWLKPGSCGSKRLVSLELSDAGIVPRLRPWQPLLATMIRDAPPRCCWPHLRASLIAASQASLPLLSRYAWSLPVLTQSRSARLSMPRLCRPKPGLISD
ncbi:hypothetical protein D3C84_807370 [compost metagenome]